MALTTYSLVTILTVLTLYYSFRRRPKNLPPGPKGHFLVGNLSLFNQAGEEKGKTLVKWFEEYGSIMHVKVFGTHTIILNTAKAASDLLDKRAAIYSHRPRLPMFNELVGNDWAVFAASGEPHKERRTLALRYFVAQYRDWQHVQLESCQALLRNLSTNPNDWAALLCLNVASSILRMTYGYEVTRTDDSLLRLVQEAVESPRNGPYLVDHFPLLKYYPSWLPGGKFHKDAEDARTVSQKLRRVPFNMVRDQMAAGTACPSFVSTLLSQLRPEEDMEHSHGAGVIRDTAATLYGAGLDTTASSMYKFLGVMVLYPDVQRRAQNELDTVLGRDQLPTFDDRRALPFIDAIVLEVLRWNAVTPLGTPHMVIEDDEYLGYHIPKGSTVFGNITAITRDPVVFPNPDGFDPSRFLATTEGSTTARRVVESSVFGWGRRSCPARHVAYSGIFIVVSHILACFEICKPVDDTGKEYEPELKYEDTIFFVRRTLPVPCRFRVRGRDRMASLDVS